MPDLNQNIDKYGNLPTPDNPFASPSTSQDSTGYSSFCERSEALKRPQPGPSSSRGCSHSTPNRPATNNSVDSPAPTYNAFVDHLKKCMGGSHAPKK